MSTKNMWLVIVALAALLAVVAAIVFIKPDQSDRPQINPPSVEDNVEDQRDEVSGDNMTGIGTGDVENTDVGVVTPNPDAAKDEKPDAQKPEQDKTPVEDDKEPEQEKEDTTPPATTPDDDKDEAPSGSGNSGSGSSGNTGSSGTGMINGHPVRAFPAGTDVNTLTPQEPFESVLIGNDEYLWDGSSWGIVDNTRNPNDYVETDGPTGVQSPFN